MGVGFESVYRRLAGGEQGAFRGGGYALSSEEQSRRGITAALPEEGTLWEYQGAVLQISDGKYRMINISPFAGNKKTVEFRGFNGTLTPGIIQANVKYAAGVVNTAERSRIRGSIEAGIIPSASDRKRGRIINNYQNTNTESDASMMSVLDAVFSRKSDKQHIMAVMAKNRW